MLIDLADTHVVGAQPASISLSLRNVSNYFLFTLLAELALACGCKQNVFIACGTFKISFCSPSSLSLRLRADASGMCLLPVECLKLFFVYPPR